MRWIGLLLLASAASLNAWAQSSTPAQRAQQARDLITGGQPEQAIPIYEELLRASPENTSLIVNLAVAQFQAGRYHDAIAQSQRALALQPDLIAASLFLGASQLKSGDPASAIEPLQKVVGTQPGDRNANLMLSEAFLGSGRNTEAAQQFLKSADLLPDEPRVWYGLARSCDAVSAESLQQLEANAPDSPYLAALAGDRAYELGRYPAAIQHYQQAITAGGPSASVYRSMGEIYRLTGHPDWANQIERRIAKLPPPDCEATPLACAVANRNYGAVLQSSATTQSAYWKAKTCAALNEQALDRLSKLAASIQLHDLQASQLEKRGLHNEAAAQWRKALQLEPNNRAAKQGLASSLYQGAGFAQAIPLFEELLRADAGSAELNFLCGSSLLLNEQPQEALPYLQKSAAADPKSLRTQAALGQALLAAGYPQDAIPHLTAALPGDEDGRISYQLARAYQSTKQSELAANAIEQYREKSKAAQAQRQAMEAAAQIAPPQ